AVGDGENTILVEIADGSTLGIAGATEIDVVREDVFVNIQGAAGIQDATATSRGLTAPRAAMSNRKTGDGDGESRVDGEGAVRVVAADGQQVSARTLDVQALGDRQLVAGQSDCPTIEARSKNDRVAVLGLGNGVPQRPRTLIEGIEDRKDAEDR